MPRMTGKLGKTSIVSRSFPFMFSSAFKAAKEKVQKEVGSSDLILPTRRTGHLDLLHVIRTHLEVLDSHITSVPCYCTQPVRTSPIKCNSLRDTKHILG